MIRLRLAICLTAALALLTVSVQAADSLPPDMIQRLKAATVYLKTALGPLEMSGSGFVIQASGDSALIVTNRHVVAKPAILQPGGYIRGLHGRDRMNLHRAQRALSSTVPVVTAVFNSGEPNEEALKAEVLCQLDEPDLAVLKVAKPKAPVVPLEFRSVPQPFETMPVFIVGFPYGEALSTNQGNPNITIGKGSVSSVRKDQNGKLAKVQIDGALNPGNSGGPVVDGQGRLIGIAVQTIQGSNIGLTIPAGALTDVLAGSLGKPSITVSPIVNGAAPKYEISASVIDPLGDLKTAVIYFVPQSVPADPGKAGQAQLKSHAGSRKIALTLQNNVARAELPLTAEQRQSLKEVTVQASFVNGQGVIVYLEPQIIAVPTPIQATVTAKAQVGNGAGRSGVTATITQTERSGNGVRTSRRQVSIFHGGSSGNSNNDDKKPSPPSPKSNSRFKVGDKVLVDWAGRTHNGEVVEIAATGWIKVKFELNGIQLTPALPPDNLTPVKSAAGGDKSKSTASASAMRTWTSKNGKYRVTAKFIELKDDSVRLEREDGETLTVALDKLTEADQQFARKQAEDNPFGSAADSE